MRVPALIRWPRTTRRGSRSSRGSFSGSEQVARRDHVRLMLTAAAANFIRMVALFHRRHAKLRVTPATITGVTFALEGRVERQISVNPHSFHARCSDAGEVSRHAAG